jgi:hypothetical protein
MRAENADRAKVRTVYKGRKSKDAKILSALKDLSLAERAAQFTGLTKQIEVTEKALEKKRTPSADKTSRKRVALIAEKDGLIELKYRLGLERSKYLVQKSITPEQDDAIEQ